jgi:hypothetical protein
MVQIEKEGDNFVFEIIGLHKLWALKSRLTIPAAHILKVYADKEKNAWVWGLRMPGTQIPGIITAGTYIVKDGTIFCDVMDVSNTIIVELYDEFYKKLVIEVEDPQKAIEMLTPK